MTTEVKPAAGSRTTVAMLGLASLVYLLLTGLDAKATAVLSGSLSFYGFKEIGLDALVFAGFGVAAWGLRRGRGFAGPTGLVASGAALWRAVDVGADAVSAAFSGDVAYWSLGQLATTAVLVAGGVFAAVAVFGLARRG